MILPVQDLAVAPNAVPLIPKRIRCPSTLGSIHSWHVAMYSALGLFAQLVLFGIVPFEVLGPRVPSEVLGPFEVDLEFSICCQIPDQTLRSGISGKT